jgi:hypothetical protein
MAECTPAPVDQGQGQGQFQRQPRRQGQRSARGTSRPRYPATDIGHGVGHGPRRCGSLASPMHRPAVTFGARRASAPARRPAVACDVRRPRGIRATSGRLDGLLGGCGAVLREATPGGAPHGIVPIETRIRAAQYRVLHARRYATFRAQWSWLQRPSHRRLTLTAEAWSVGMSTISRTLAWGGRVVQNTTASATSSAVSGRIPV